MWILKPIPLFRLPFTGELFGIGIRIDYTWIVHIIIYGIIVYALSFLFSALFQRKGGVLNHIDEIRRRGLFGSICANFAIEFVQGNIYNYDPRNYFGIGDFVLSLTAAILVYFLLKKIPFKRIFSRGERKKL